MISILFLVKYQNILYVCVFILGVILLSDYGRDKHQL